MDQTITTATDRFNIMFVNMVERVCVLEEQLEIALAHTKELEAQVLEFTEKPVEEFSDLND